MSDSIGGLVNIVIITLFIVIAIGYIAFNINYTKAFRAKDKIIALFEKYEGNCINTTGKCYKEIQAYADEIGYKPSSLNPKPSQYNGYNSVGELFLYKEVYDGTVPTGPYQVYPSKKKHYEIVTKMNMEIPIITNIFPIQYFFITGSTQTITE